MVSKELPHRKNEDTLDEPKVTLSPQLGVIGGVRRSGHPRVVCCVINGIGRLDTQ